MEIKLLDLSPYWRLNKQNFGRFLSIKTRCTYLPTYLPISFSRCRSKKASKQHSVSSFSILALHFTTRMDIRTFILTVHSSPCQGIDRFFTYKRGTLMYLSNLHIMLFLVVFNIKTSIYYLLTRKRFRARVKNLQGRGSDDTHSLTLPGAAQRACTAHEWKSNKLRKRRLFLFSFANFLLFSTTESLKSNTQAHRDRDRQLSLEKQESKD